MDVKDILTLFALVATIISSHVLVSQQIRKSKRAAWIEDLRKELARFIALSTSITPESQNTALLEIAQSGTMISFLLDDRNPVHLQLQETIQDMISLLLARQGDPPGQAAYAAQLDTVLRTGKDILAREMRRL